MDLKEIGARYLRRHSIAGDDAGQKSRRRSTGASYQTGKEDRRRSAPSPPLTNEALFEGRMMFSSTSAILGAHESAHQRKVAEIDHHEKSKCDGSTDSATHSEVTIRRRNSQESLVSAPVHEVSFGSTGSTSDQADARDQEIRDLKAAAKTNQSIILSLTTEVRHLNRQLTQDRETSRGELSSLKMELMASYRKNVSISKAKNAEIDRLGSEIEKRDATVQRLQEELAILKMSM